MTGTFDKIVSIEMFEAVGEANWPTYFNMLNRALKPGGRAALQIITIDDDRFAHYRQGTDFIQRYIFPGGMLPSPQALESKIAAADLHLESARYFGRDYAETLRRWQARFRNNWTLISELGFDDRFFRLWTYYLSYCEAGFRAETIDVGHFLLQKP